MNRNERGQYAPQRDALIAEWQMEALERLAAARSAIDNAERWIVTANQTLTNSNRAA